LLATLSFSVLMASITFSVISSTRGTITHCMPSILESGTLRLPSEEVNAYRATADCLRQSCEMVVDLKKPITMDEWIFLAIARAALSGDLRLLDRAIAGVKAEIASRKQHS